MSRSDDVIAARAAADEWASAHGLPPSGGYSGDWYVNGYLGGWWPAGWLYWLADYSKPPELFPMRPAHQYTSTPIDMDVMLDSEIVGGDVTDEERAQMQARIDSLLTTIAVMGGDVAASLEHTGAVLHAQAVAKRMTRTQIGGSANNVTAVVAELRRLRVEAGD